MLLNFALIVVNSWLRKVCVDVATNKQLDTLTVGIEFTRISVKFCEFHTDYGCFPLGLPPAAIRAIEMRIKKSRQIFRHKNIQNFIFWDKNERSHQW